MRSNLPEPLDELTRRRMQRQRRRDTVVEVCIRKSLHRAGFRFRVDYRPEKSLRCKGDVVFTRWKVIVFVDGCFWHGCPLHATSPANNSEWWQEKLHANVERDKRNTRALEELGWKVVRVWEHENSDEAAERIERVLKQVRPS
jgi:DNA mismatch endonuclease (patch repair protein)